MPPRRERSNIGSAHDAIVSASIVGGGVECRATIEEEGDWSMTIKGKAYIAGIHEHPTRKADTQSLAQLHAESAMGALADAGLTKDDVDGYFCAGDAPGLGPLSMADYMGLKLCHMDTTETGGSSYVIHVAHAAEAIALGKCSVALITLAGRPRAEGMATGTVPRAPVAAAPE